MQYTLTVVATCFAHRSDFNIIRVDENKILVLR